jgi:hypothetical protein
VVGSSYTRMLNLYPYFYHYLLHFYYAKFVVRYARALDKITILMLKLESTYDQSKQSHHQTVN